MSVALERRSKFRGRCIHTGAKLARMPYWKSHILAELCSWITLFFGSSNNTVVLVKPYNSVLNEICQTEYDFRNDCERALGLSYCALCNIWVDFQLTATENVQTFIPWLRCTALVVAQTYPFLSQPSPAITSDFETFFCVPLRDALLQAATRFKTALRENDGSDIPCGWKEVLEIITELVEDIASRTPKDADPEGAGQLDRELVDRVEDGIDKVQGGLRAMAAEKVL
ncbi:hypothetical protein DFH06DRAFT_1178681, partial [Mycena polygramma]